MGHLNGDQLDCVSVHHDLDDGTGSYQHVDGDGFTVVLAIIGLLAGALVALRRGR